MTRSQATPASSQILTLERMLAERDAEIERLKEHADSEGSRAVEYLRRARKAEAEIERLRALLLRYRNETPLGHQPHMIAYEVDAALKETP